MPADHIFLSYRSTEREFAARLRDDLDVNGVSVWMDDHGGIEGGDNWRQSIEDALDSSTALIAVISPGYLKSKWCQRELNRADSNDIPIIPVYIKQVAKFPIVIEGIQYIDFRDALNDDEAYDQHFAELIEQVQEKTNVTVNEGEPVVTTSKRQFTWRGRRPEGFTLYGLITLFLTLVGVAVGILALPDERLQLLQDAWSNLTRPPDAALFDPTLEELSFDVERASLHRELDDVSSPHGLTTAPAPGGYGIWGYGDANHVLFAADVGTGELLSLGEDTDTLRLPNNFLPSALHYDGVWVWVGDARRDRIIALDPLNPSAEPLADYDLSGEPTAIAHTGEIVWVAQQEADQVTSLAVDHATASITPHCPGGSISLDAPSRIAAQGRTAVWVAGAETVSRVNVQSCDTLKSVSLGAQITGLSWAAETLWIASGGDLYRLAESDDTAVPVELSSEVAVSDVLAVNGALWLVTDEGNLLYYEPETGAYTVEITGNAIINSLTANGRQIWATREDNTLSRYIVPDYVYPGLMEMAWADGALWVVSDEDDNGYNLCGIHDGRRDCHTLEIDAEPVTLTTAAGGATLWLGLANNRLLQIDPESGDVLDQLAATGVAAPEAIVSAGSELWVSDLFSATTVIDVTSGSQTTLESLNVAVPAALAYDGANVWFADTFTGQVFTVERDGAQLRQGRAFELPLSGKEGIHLLVAGDALVLVMSGSMYTVSPASGDVEQVIGIGDAVDDVAVGGDGVWIANQSNGFIYMVD